MPASDFCPVQGEGYNLEDTILEIIYYVATSVDGYIATPDGGVDWLTPFEQADQDYGYAAFYASIDALVMGSRTYEQILGFDEWPYAAKPVWVLSSQKLEPIAPEVTVTPHGPRKVVAELAERHLKRVWLVGGSKLGASFRTAGLIGEYIISVIPVILGGGIPLLNHSVSKDDLSLADLTQYGNGVVQLRYRTLSR